VGHTGVLRTSALLAAPVSVVVEAARDVATVGLPVEPPGIARGLVTSGDVLVLRLGRRRIRARIESRPPDLVAAYMSGLSYRQWFRATGAGTLMTAELCWPGRVPLLARRRALSILTRRDESIAALVATRLRVVVGAALLADGRVLAARRRDIDGWELPGGKVEPGEAPAAALRREIAEELDIDIELADRVGGDVAINASSVLRIWSARISRGTPVAREHSALRWLAADELDQVDWLPADRVLLPELRSLLTFPGQSAL
jgi:8-oxo-dGTP diphosphatase